MSCHCFLRVRIITEPPLGHPNPLTAEFQLVSPGPLDGITASPELVFSNPLDGLPFRASDRRRHRTSASHTT